MEILSQQGYSYSFDPEACKGCAGYCCRGREGNIWVNARELEQIADFLAVNIVDLMRQYIQPVSNRLTIKEHYREGQFACIFFEELENSCGIYPARPEQCRTFPFWEHYRDREGELAQECPGVQLAR